MSDPNRMTRDQLIARVDALEAQIDAMRDSNEPAIQLRIQNAFGLTPHECKLVMLLADGKPRRKEQIMSGLYSDRIDDPPEIKIIDVWVCKIRRKLDAYGVYIETVWGSGYFLTDSMGVVKRVMDGQEPLPANSLPARPHPPHVEKRSHGQDALRVLAYITENGGKKGKVSFTSRELAARTGVRRTVASLMVWLEQRRLISIIDRPTPGGRAKKQWSVTVLPGASA